MYSDVGGRKNLREVSGLWKTILNRSEVGGDL